MEIEITLYEDEKRFEKKIIEHFNSGNENVFIPEFLGQPVQRLNINYKKRPKPFDIKTANNL